MFAIRGWRIGVGATIAVAAVAALISGRLMPNGPLTTFQALATMVSGVAVGLLAGAATRSRWAMLVAPFAFVCVFELSALAFRHSGNTEFVVSRGLYGLVGLVPMMLGATFSAALTRRNLNVPGVGRSMPHFWMYVRRVITGITTVAMITLAFGIARPADTKPFRDAKGDRMAGSLSEKTHVEINGVRQGMFIKSKNINNPVLLFVHGGPGMPEYWLTQRYPTGLEEHFTVVWWEQRGAGLSYDPAIAPSTMTADQFVADTLAVTRYLRQRFGQKKIYLMGHSWGSLIGIQAAAKAPELYAAYIGVGQISYQIESEQVAYKYALGFYEDRENRKMLRKLRAAPPGATAPLPANYLKLRDEYMHRAGIGTTREMKSVISGLFLPSWRFREYTLMEKVNLWRGKISARQATFGLWDNMLTTDLRKKVTALEIPVYFFHGRYDYTSAYPMAKDYLLQISAPVKGFYTFENSAHSPMFEEPERTVAIMLTDVVNGTRSLADHS